MESLLAARLQMAFSLGFHIIFACIGMVMPILMSLAYFRYVRHRDEASLELTKIWMKGVAIFFAVGAVSGTLLSFELGLLWPRFMEHAGPIIGMPFSWEGAAFFLEAIALGIFLYGFGRLPLWIHWTSSLVVGISGVISGVFVVAANAWMNSPTGFDYVNGEFTNIDPWRAFFNPAWFSEAHHMTLAAFTAVSAAVLGTHAILFLLGKRRDLNRLAIRVSAPVFVISALLQPISGDLIAKDVAIRQPMKLAAMEALFETQKSAPLLIGGIPDQKNKTVHFGVELPGMLSFLAHGSLETEVKGLEEIPEENWPPVLITHIAFQIMVGIGSYLALVALVALSIRWRSGDWVEKRWALKLYASTIPLGFIAVEAGWTVTEVGRQPWIIYEIMKVKDAVTDAPFLGLTFAFYLFLYLILFAVVAWLFYRLILVSFLQEKNP